MKRATEDESPAIPVILRWMEPGTQNYLFNKLHVATTLPFIPRLGDYFVSPRPKASKDSDATLAGEFDTAKIDVDATVRAVRISGEGSLRPWRIEIFLDVVLLSDGWPDPRVRRP